jgi:hypothetical protein
MQWHRVGTRPTMSFLLFALLLLSTATATATGQHLQLVRHPKPAVEGHLQLQSPESQPASVSTPNAARAIIDKGGAGLPSRLDAGNRGGSYRKRQDELIAAQVAGAVAFALAASQPSPGPTPPPVITSSRRQTQAGEEPREDKEQDYRVRGVFTTDPSDAAHIDARQAATGRFTTLQVLGATATVTLLPVIGLDGQIVTPVVIPVTTSSVAGAAPTTVPAAAPPPAQTTLTSIAVQTSLVVQTSLAVQTSVEVVTSTAVVGNPGAPVSASSAKPSVVTVTASAVPVASMSPSNTTGAAVSLGSPRGWIHGDPALGTRVCC